MMAMLTSPFGSFAQLLPYGVHWTPQVHRLRRNRTLVTVFEVEGFDRLTSTKEEMARRAIAIREVFDRLGSQWFFECHVTRSEYTTVPDPGPLRNRTLYLLHQEHMALFDQRDKYFRNRTYIVAARRGDSSAAKILQRWFGASPLDQEIDADDHEVELFEKGIEDLSGALRTAYRRIRRLGTEVVSDEDGAQYVHDHTAGFFDEMVTHRKGPLVATLEDPPFVSGSIGLVDVEFGEYPYVNGQHHACVSIDGFAPYSIAGIAEFLAHSPFASRWWSRYQPMSQSAALFRLQWRRRAAVARSREAEGSNPLALSTKVAIEDAIGKASELGMGYGLYTGGIILHGERPIDLRESASSLVELLRKKSFSARLEDRVAPRTLLQSYPGNEDKQIRPSLISTWNASHLIALSSVWTGHETHPNPKYPAGTPPTRVGVGVGNIPVNLTPSFLDIGHTGMPGPSGNGKSTAIKALIVGTLINVKRSVVVLLDSDNQAKALTKAVGGIHIDISAEKVLPKLCPAAWIANGPLQQEQFRNWLEDSYVLNLQRKLTLEEMKDLDNAVRLFASAPTRSRSLSQFSLNLGLDSLRQANREFERDTDGYGLLDADESLMPTRAQLGGEPSLITIEVGRMALAPRKLVPILMAIFDWVETLLDGNPTVLCADEVVKFFRDGRYAARFDRLGRELRKMNGSFWTASQYYEDYTEGDVATVVSRAVRNWLFVANSAAMEEKGGNSLMTVAERELISSREFLPKRHYLFKNDDGTMPLSFELGPIELALIGRDSAGDIAAFMECENEVVAANRAEGRKPGDPDYQDYTVPLWLHKCGIPHEQIKRWTAGDPRVTRSEETLVVPDFSKSGERV